MAPRGKRRFWRWCRFCFRQVRITFWLLLLVLVGILVYCNQVSLPQFVKTPLLQTLREHGLDLEFSRLRLRWNRGIVADDVRFERVGEPYSPQLTVREVQVRLNHAALRKFQLQIDSLLLRQGQLVWPIPETNAPPRHLAVEDIQTELRLLPDDQWELQRFTATFAGARIRLSGTLTNATAVREWKFLPTRQPTQAGVWQTRLRQLADVLERIRFSATPELRLDVHGDARDLTSFGARLMINAPGAQTPWGMLRDGRCLARLLPEASNELSRAELTLVAAAAQTPWATTTNLQLSLRLLSLESQTNLLDADLEMTADQVATEWASASHARFVGHWVHALTNPVPLSGSGRLQCESAASRWVKGRNLEWSGQLVTVPADRVLPANPAWAGWTNLQPYALDWQCHFGLLQSSNLDLAEIALGGTWRAPHLILTNLQAALDGGHVQAHAELDVGTRLLKAELNSDIDPHRVSPSLSADVRSWLADCTWKKAPRLALALSLELPSWTNRAPDWGAGLLERLSLRGQFQLDQGGAYRGIEVTGASAHFNYSNGLWRVPDLRITRPEGHLEAEQRADQQSKEFYLRVASTIDPGCLRPLLGAKEQQTFDLFKLTQPPELEGEIRGHYNDLQRLGFRGRVALTNFTFREQTVSGFQTYVNYTNQLLEFTTVRLQRGAERLEADGLLADLRAEKIFLANGFSTASPEAVTRGIGPHVWRAIEPYRFDQNPTVRAHGTIPIHDDNVADLYLDISGGPFHWWEFNPRRIRAAVHWTGQSVALSNVTSDFYGGRLNGAANFKLHPGKPTDYQFDLDVTNILLQALMADISTRSNRLEGRVSGTLVIVKGNTGDWRSNFGYGDIKLRDGLIWEIPLFGIFSPVLDGLSPGLGSSRASSGTCTFMITNGVIRSDDLDIRSPAMRLAYRGTVDLQQRVHARVEAELLRDMWLVGPLVSTVFWPVTKMFEYRVTGSLGQPKTQSVYLVPKLVLLPFRPLRMLKALIPEETNANRTNAPTSGK